MSIKSTLIAACAALTAAVSPMAAFAGTQDFVLRNETGEEILELFVSPSELDDWKDDILGGGTLPDGEQGDVTFTYDDDVCEFDLLVTYTEDSRVQWGGLNLCDISKVTLYLDADTGETTANVE